MAKKSSMKRPDLETLNWISDLSTPLPRTLLIHSHPQSQQHRHHNSQKITADQLPGPIQITHTTKPNETLSGIAQRYGTHPDKIRYWNKTAHLKPLKPQQDLTIWLRPQETIVYVKADETLSHLARRYHCHVTDIIQRNKLSDHKLKIHQKLIIPRPRKSHATSQKSL